MTCFLVSNRAQCYTVLTESYTDVFIQNCEDELFIPGKLDGKNLKTGGDLLIFFFFLILIFWDVPGSFHIYVSSELTLLILWCSVLWILTCVNLSQRGDQWVRQSRLTLLPGGDGDILQITLKMTKLCLTRWFFVVHVNSYTWCNLLAEHLIAFNIRSIISCDCAHICDKLWFIKLFEKHVHESRK